MIFEQQMSVTVKLSACINNLQMLAARLDGDDIAESGKGGLIHAGLAYQRFAATNSEQIG